MIPEEQLQNEITLINRIQAVPTILQVICRTTKMGFAAIARVTEDRWIACSVRDEINFGLLPGGELKIETTICNEIRDSGKLVVFDNAAEDPAYAEHHTPRIYGLKSYISVPIFLNNGEFFGTLCAIDPRPANINNPETIGMFQLFTELIAFHFELLQETERMKDDLYRTSQQLHGYKEEVSQYNRLTNHSLQEPLRKMRLYADMLVEVSEQGATTKIAAAAQKMRKFADDLSYMVRDINQYSAVNMMGSEWQVCDLNDIVNTVVNRMKLSLEQQQAVVESDVLHTVKGIQGHLHRLFYILIGNAVKYARPGVPPRIRISSKDYLPAEGIQAVELNARFRYCEILIEDNGVGFHSAELSHVFDLISKDGGGLATGLAQVKKIVYGHQGKIAIRSTVGLGSVFSIILPIDQ